MTKFRFFADFEKEEAWLDEMSEAGWRLEKVIPSIGMYVFDQVEEGSFCPKVRIDFRIVPKKEKSDYIRLFEESGWENISASNLNGQYYFRQISEASENDIFSDSSSATRRYKRTGNVLALLSTVLFVTCILHITIIIDAARQSESVFVVISSVICVFSFVLGLIILLIGYNLLKKYKKRSEKEAAITENDRTVHRDRTTGLFLRRMILLPVTGGLIGFIAGTLFFYIQNR